MEARAWLCAGALLLASPAPALAESPSKRAAALFKEGRAAMQRDAFAEACPKFAESAKLDPAPGTILNLALCQEALGRIGQALESFRIVIALLPPDDERVPFAKEHAGALEPRVPRLTLLVPPEVPASAKVLCDGEEVAHADLGVADPIEPGSHEVTLRIPGERDARFPITLVEGERRTLMLRPRAAPIAQTTIPWRTVGFVAGGVGVASLAASAITGALVLDKKATVDASCHGTAVCDTQEGVDAASAGGTLAAISTITFLAGAALAGAGVYLVLTRDDGAPAAPSGASPAGTTALAPTIVPGGGGLLVWRRF